MDTPHVDYRNYKAEAPLAEVIKVCAEDGGHVLIGFRLSAEDGAHELDLFIGRESAERLIEGLPRMLSAIENRNSQRN